MEFVVVLVVCMYMVPCRQESFYVCVLKLVLSIFKKKLELMAPGRQKHILVENSLP
jgi:hypothetical protein